MYKRFEFNVQFHKDKSACEVKLVKIDDTNLIFVKDIDEGMSICNAFEFLFPQVLAHFNLSPDDIHWIEFWEKQYLIDDEDEYSLVSYELKNGKAQKPNWTYLGESEEEAIHAIKNRSLTSVY
ncbi:MAG: hypothetical protein VKL42_08905 [Snowella sp.]|nr:hypothetical protein [Snowella sp.]